MEQVKKGATSHSIYFEVLDSTSTSGGRKTGLVFNTAGLTAYYARKRGTATAITLATLAAADSAWSSGGFKEVDATNMPGVYRLDVPDAALATGADGVVVTLKGATGMAQVSKEIQLVDNTAKDVFDRVGAPAGASIAADIGTRASQASLDTLDDYVDTEVAAIKAKTDNLPAAPAAVGDIPSAASIASTVWATACDGAVTAIQLMRGFAAVLMGKVSGADANNPVFRNLGDTKDVVSTTGDANGNRTAVVRDLT